MVQAIRIWGNPVYTMIANYNGVRRAITLNGAVLKHFVPVMISAPANDMYGQVA